MCVPPPQCFVFVHPIILSDLNENNSDGLSIRMTSLFQARLEKYVTALVPLCGPNGLRKVFLTTASQYFE